MRWAIGPGFGEYFGSLGMRFYDAAMYRARYQVWELKGILKALGGA